MTDMQVNQNEQVALVLPAAFAESTETTTKRFQKAQDKYVKDLLSVGTAIGGAKISAKQESGKVVIPAPTQAQQTQYYSNLQDPNNFSIVALIGEVLALQAKTNTNFWSTLWKEASMGMRQAVEFAPLIAAAVKESFNQQANQSEQEGKMAMNNAIISGVMFGVTLGMGAFDVRKENKATPDNVGSKQENVDGLPGEGDNNALEDDNLLNLNDMNGEDSENNEIDVDQEDVPQETTANRLREQLQDTAGTAATKFKDGGQAFWNKSGGAVKFSFKTLEKAATKAMMTSMMNNIGMQANESVMKSKIAGIQRKTGAAEAASKEMEQFAQYWNQLFSRAEDLRQGSQQFIDFAMNILKSVSDTVTQTVQSMFRG